ncbi:hypothetical protein GCM10011390_19440 [Aureimonas endophytica]|uniref:Uncharacterized protein n=1 Tax=Aureimonas endophytica TaxID=2027858 RepID=A0A916ZK85_9HYPH|nr:hypothetical protein [Aureimonas endophytica]GGE00729.1 hypothetical protein GCM10011390_19440 [Aureimonas endophytica]
MRTAATLFLLCLAAPAGAQSLMPGPASPGRYEMQPIEGGVARLDTVTGEVSLCRLERGNLNCRPADESDEAAPSSPEGRQAAPLEDSRRDDEGDDARDARTDAELDRAIGCVKRVFRAFRDLAHEFEDEDRDRRGTADEPGPDRT